VSQSECGEGEKSVEGEYERVVSKRKSDVSGLLGDGYGCPQYLGGDSFGLGAFSNSMLGDVLAKSRRWYNFGTEMDVGGSSRTRKGSNQRHVRISRTYTHE
jgi:hypothetical protein